MKLKKMTLIGVLTAAALCIYVLESCVPPVVPLPGVKLGLANGITLIALYLLGGREAFAVLILRVLLGAFFTGQAISLLYSLSGGLLCFGVMLFFKHCLEKNQIWAVSIFGAFAHNVGQILIAMLLVSDCRVAYYFLVLVVSSIMTGAFTGFAAQLCIHKLKKSNLFNNKQ